MYLMHLAASIVAQNVLIPSIKSCFVFGLASLLMNSFISCHRFSMGLQSGDSAGVFHQLMEFLVKNSCAFLDVCLGSLSSMCCWSWVDDLNKR